MKNHGLDGYKKLRGTLSNRFRECSNYAERENNLLEATRADAYVKDMFGSTDMTKAGEEVKKARREFVANQTVELVDPLDIQKRIEELDDQINTFMVEVDAALSVSNATTEITVKY